MKKYALQLHIVLLLVSCLAVLSGGGQVSSSAASPPKVQVIIRYDDYSGASAMAADRGLLRVLQKYRIPAVFSVVPYAYRGEPPDLSRVYPLDPEKVRLLRWAVGQGLVEVALHGNSHLNHLPEARDPTEFSEFSGTPRSQQIELIKTGLAELKNKTGLSTAVFVPPWGTYDAATLDALSHAGFKIISAGKNGCTDDCMLFAPDTTDITRFESDVINARRSGQAGAYVVLLLHPEDFYESRHKRATVSVPDFESMVARLTADKGIEFTTLSGLLKTKEDLSAQRFRANRDMAQAAWALSGWLRPKISWGAYVPYRSASALLREAHLRRAWLLMSFLFAGIVSSVVVRRLYPGRRGVAVSVAVVLAAIAVAYGQWLSTGLLQNRELVLLCFSAGCLVYSTLWAVGLAWRRHGTVSGRVQRVAGRP